MCRELEIPYTCLKTDIREIVFDVRQEDNPCSLCAKMRRGALNDAIKARGISKLALGHHFDDAVETFMMSLIFEGRLSCFRPVTYMKYFKQVFKKYDDLNASVQENVSSIRVVKSYVREKYENKKFRKASANLYKMFVSAERIVSWNGPIMNATVYTCILVISWLGAHMIVSGSLTTGELMSLLTYCMPLLLRHHQDFFKIVFRGLLNLHALTPLSLG